MKNFSKISSKWDKIINFSIKENNIPIISEQDIKAINCSVISNNEYFVLKTPTIIFQTIINYGKDFLKDYILHPDYGNGIYLEKHNTPHIYTPLTKNTSGYIVLGVHINNNLYIGAYNIPNGKALYIPPNIIHNDCFLQGAYRVFYTVNESIEKCLIRNENNELINFNFV